MATTNAMQKTNEPNAIQKADNKPAVPNPARELKAYFEKDAVKNKLAEVAAKYFDPKELTRLALLAASRSPDLLKCTQDSILRSLIDAAELGIKPGGTMGRGYLVPRKNKKQGTYECSFDPGWRGLCDIARRSGKVHRIEAHVVFDADEFYVENNPFTTVRHVPFEGNAKQRGNIRAAFGVSEFDTGKTQTEVVYKVDLDKIRAVSAAQNGPWSNWADEMSRKSAVRRLCKYLPYDPLLERAMRLSDEADDNDFQTGAVSVQPMQAKLARQISQRSVSSNVAPNIPLGAPADDDPDLSMSNDEFDPGEQQAAGEPEAAAAPVSDGVERDPNTGEIVPSAEELAGK